MNISFWLLPWEPSYCVVFLTVFTALSYIYGGRKARPEIGQMICFWLGLGSLYIVSQTGFDYYAEHQFFVHRIQHNVLHHMAPFLLALSRPRATLVAGMPTPIRNMCKAFLRNSLVDDVIRILNQPILAVILFITLTGLWLIPSIHFMSMLDWRLYRLMNWGMVINGLMFWNLALNNYALRQETYSVGARIGMMLALIPPQIILGMLIFAAPRDLYPIYVICGRAFAGLDPLADQQMGGLLIWISPAMMSIFGMLVVIKHALTSAEPNSYAPDHV